MKKLMILGAGGHGKVVADIARLCGYEQIAFLDDDTTKTAWVSYPVLGTTQQFQQYSDWEFFVAMGNSQLRQQLHDALAEAGKTIATLVHPKAVVAQSAQLGRGSIVMAGVVINPDAVIGDGCIINTCASVDHDCVVEDFCHISVGSHLSGTVHLQQHVLLGIGATVSNNLTICPNCTIGAGAAVITDICQSGTYIGVPAKKQ